MNQSPAANANSSTLNRGNRRIGIALLIAAVAGLGAAVWHQSRLVLPAGITSEEYHRAGQQFRELYQRPPERTDVFSLLGERSVADGQLDRAVVCFREIPGSHPRYGPSARLQEGQVLMKLNRALEAERAFRQFLVLAGSGRLASPQHQRTASQWLVFLLSVELRLEDRKSVLAQMHKRQIAGVWESKLYYFPHQLIWNSMDGRERLWKFLQQDPDSLPLKLARGRYLIVAGELDLALQHLSELHLQYPDDPAVTAALLACHFERDDWSAFSQLAESLDEAANGEPWQLTRMRGEFALYERRWEEALVHFQRLLDQDPANPFSHMGMARAYGELGRAEDRAAMLERSRILADIRVNMYNVSESDPQGCRALADKCESIGMPRAARTFREHAQRIDRQAAGFSPDLSSSAPASGETATPLSAPERHLPE